MSSASFTYETLFDLDVKQQRVREINAKMGETGFWDHPETAQALVGELRQLNLTLKPLEELSRGADALNALEELADEDDTGETVTELKVLGQRLEGMLESVELKAMMSDPHDPSGAYLSIQAGEGGTDSSDWAEMLLRMYQRWVEREDYDIELLEISPAEEAGIRSVTIAIRGDYAFGYLKGETGNHRLIRISPFDSAGRRHTSFAAVDVTPEIDDDFDIDIDWDKDVREDTYRAGGAGGQHVNKTDSAVRLTYLPSNIVVQCQNERSQHKNRASARKMLAAKLLRLEQEKREAESAARRGSKSKIGFGGETVRNYVLHPEHYAQSTRTGEKSGNLMHFLDGDLNRFLETYLRWALDHK